MNVFSRQIFGGVQFREMALCDWFRLDIQLRKTFAQIKVIFFLFFAFVTFLRILLFLRQMVKIFSPSFFLCENDLFFLLIIYLVFVKKFSSLNFELWVWNSRIIMWALFSHSWSGHFSCLRQPLHLCLMIFFSQYLKICELNNTF